ncbi:MAG: hypothetical protein WDN25_09390 [Acetobacteraceae bacterium]
MRQAVHELLRALGPLAGGLLRTHRYHLGLLPDGLLLELGGSPKPLFAGEFRQVLLDDLDGLDPAFDAWLEEQRQRVVRPPADRCSGEQRSRAEPRPVAGSALTAPLAPVMAQRAVGKAVTLRVLALRSLDDDGPTCLLPGLADEVAAAVSRFRWISCIAAPDSRRIPPVRPQADRDYLLDSTVQRSGPRVRVMMRLLDLSAGGDVIWARRFDRQIGDALLLQSDIAAETAAQVDAELLLREGERRAACVLDLAAAHDLTLRAIPAIYRLEAVGFRAAGDLLAAAVAAEPGNAAAHAWWAYWHLFLVGQGWAADPADAARRAGDLAERAVTLDPGDARAVALVGHVRGFLHKRAEEACTLHERALSLNPNLPLAWCFSGLAHCYLGRHAIAIEHIGRAQFLAPYDPHAFFFDMALMMPHFLLGDFDQALVLGRRAVELNPGFTSTYKGYLATLGQLGRDQEAARVLTRLLALEPGFCVRSAILRSPMTRQPDLDSYAEGLRRAGLPDG